MYSERFSKVEIPALWLALWLCAPPCGELFMTSLSSGSSVFLSPRVCLSLCDFVGVSALVPREGDPGELESKPFLQC